MGQEYENLEEDREYLARREQRRRRMLEAKRRRKRHRQIALICSCLLVVCIVAAVSVRMLGKISMAKQSEDPVVTEDAAKDDAAGADMQAEEDESGREDDAAAEGSEAADSEKEQKTKVYRFEETSDTVPIYSEEVYSTYGILVDAENNTIVASKSAKERISPASMTKVLTVLVAAEHLQEEDLDDTFTMTLEITDYAYVNDCSSVGFLDEEKVKVRDLFYGTILPSGGDAAVGLATYVAGSHEAFVDMMNDKLEELGISDTAHFTNCVGLYDENHYCTIYDMAVIMKAAMENELCRQVLYTRHYTTEATEQHPEGISISNWFMRRIEDKDIGGEIMGAKTGYVVESGNCAVSCSVQADGTLYICATAGAHSGWRCIYDHVEIYNRYVPKI